VYPFERIQDMHDQRVAAGGNLTDQNQDHGCGSIAILRQRRPSVSRIRPRTCPGRPPRGALSARSPIDRGGRVRSSARIRAGSAPITGSSLALGLALGLSPHPARKYSAMLDTPTSRDSRRKAGRQRRPSMARTRCVLGTDATTNLTGRLPGAAADRINEETTG
jgi:hypothetical protein